MQSNSTILTGTLPVRPFDPTRFIGTIRTDGQSVRVAAIATTDMPLKDGKTSHQAVFLSLVGFDTSVSALLATFFKKEALLFAPDEDISWTGPRRLERMGLNYKQIETAINGTREKHYITLPYAAHIADGALHPPQIPAALTKKGRENRDKNGADAGEERTPDPRFIFGTVDETTPNCESFLGHLIALRVIIIRSPDLRPLMTRWVNQFWLQGIDRGLIQPIPAAGITAWQISGDLVQWNTIIMDGIRQGWLPTALNGTVLPFPQAMERAA